MIPAPLPQGRYNAAVDLLDRNLRRHPDKVAYVDADGDCTYLALAARVDRAAGGLRALGFAPGDRLVLCLLDSVDFVAMFLGAIKAGVVPIPLNTLLTADDYAYILADSEARAAVVSSGLAAAFEAARRSIAWPGQVFVAGRAEGAQTALSVLLDAGAAIEAHPSDAQDVAFWLYSSGSTGRPKGAPHRQGSLAATAELFGRRTLGLRADDVIFSAAKLFFAYGLGNALSFPMTVGASACLWPDRATPEAVRHILRAHRPTIFCGAPTLYAALLADGGLTAADAPALRLCLSAGEALPAEIARAWKRRMGVEIVDGIGCTEMLHIFVSDRPGATDPGVTGWPVEGYEVRLLDEDGQETATGAVGELLVRGPSMTLGYWKQAEKTAATFQAGWMRTGDKFRRRGDGALIYCGRADDMLKVSGVWVSPAEVEGALMAHPAVLEAAVIGAVDAAELTKSKAFVVLKPGFGDGADMVAELQAFTKSRLAAYKYPRTIAFVDQLPKTATGKIQRHLLRDQDAASRAKAPP